MKMDNGKTKAQAQTVTLWNEPPSGGLPESICIEVRRGRNHKGFLAWGLAMSNTIGCATLTIPAARDLYTKLGTVLERYENKRSIKP